MNTGADNTIDTDGKSRAPSTVYPEEWKLSLTQTLDSAAKTQEIQDFRTRITLLVFNEQTSDGKM